MIDNLGTPSSELQINFGVLQIDTENFATGVFCLTPCLPQNFYHTNTDRHFPEIVRSSSGHPKTCKSIKNRKSKICTKPILSSSYTEESNKEETTIIVNTIHNLQYQMLHDISPLIFQHFLSVSYLKDFPFM